MGIHGKVWSTYWGAALSPAFQAPSRGRSVKSGLRIGGLSVSDFLNLPKVLASLPRLEDVIASLPTLEATIASLCLPGSFLGSVSPTGDGLDEPPA